MAQTGFTPIQLYSTSTAAAAPDAGNLTNSTLGSELAINITDGKLFYKDNANAVQVIAWKVTPTTAGGTGLTTYTAGDLVYYASGSTFTKLPIGASGRYLSSTGSAPQWSAPGALTKVDDTNVTLTLGGSPTTALLNAASITVGWSGFLSTARGGTGRGSFTANAVLYASDANTIAANPNFTYNGTNLTLGDGNLVIGTSGKGIDFSATPGTGTSELFADYEEGTWTPTVTPATGSFTTVTAGTSTYTKIGRVVTISGRFTLTNSGTGAGNMTIAGLPFTILSAYDQNTMVGRIVNTGTPIFGQLVGSTTTIDSFATIAGTTAITNGYIYTFTATYTA